MIPCLRIALVVCLTACLCQFVHVLPAAPVDDLSAPVQRFTTPAPGIQLSELTAATRAFREGDVQQCRKYLQAAKDKLAARPGAGELPPIDLMVARLYMSQGQLAIGKNMLEKVAIEHEEHPEVYLLFGNLALAEGRLTDALLHFERAGALADKKSESIARLRESGLGQQPGWSPDQQRATYREAYAGIATVAERRENWFKAQVALKQWVKTDPQNAGVRDRLGAALFMIGREDEALVQFAEAHRLNSKINRPEVSIAVMHARQNDFRKARKAFADAIKKYPDDARVYQEFAGMLLLAGDAAEAKKQAAKAAQLGTSDSGLAMHRGYIARQLGEFSEAEKFFASVVAQSPSDFESSNQLALVLIEQKDEAKQQRARELAEMNVRRFPQSSFALSTYGWVLFKLGDKQRAIQALQAAAAQPNVRSETLYFLARAMWEDGQKSDARELAKQVKLAVDRPGLFVLRPEAQQWLQSESLN